MHTVSWFHGERALVRLLENDGQVYISTWRWAYRCGACGKVSDLGHRTESAECG
jgi:hypothetical protein